MEHPAFAIGMAPLTGLTSAASNKSSSLTPASSSSESLDDMRASAKNGIEPSYGVGICKYVGVYINV